MRGCESNPPAQLIRDCLYPPRRAADHDVYRVMAELVLSRIYDENNTPKGQEYEFQRRPGEGASQTVARLQDLCKIAAKDIGTTIDSPFGQLQASPQKLCTAVSYLEGYSFTKNTFSANADVLGDFFEQTIGSEFKQGKGQFFTHRSIARFILRMARLDDPETARAGLEAGRWPPSVIDPSCGSGTFLIEALRQVAQSATALSESAHSLTGEQEEWLNRVKGSRELSRVWTKDRFFGIDSHQDLNLGCKVNLLAHKADARKILCCDTLSKDFAQRLGDRMGEFDLLVSNPPFSVTLSKEERANLKQDYTLLQKDESVASEHLFLERWHQLLREGGTLVAVVPETMCDSPLTLAARSFLLENFNLQAVIALPSVAFEPFTSTRTVALLATKKTAAESEQWRDAMDASQGTHQERVRASLEKEKGKVFMAEPQTVGYKRRTGKPDLELADDLIGSEGEGALSVLGSWNGGSLAQGQLQDRQFGFWVDLADVARSSASLRCDPKYMWRKGACDSLAFDSIGSREPGASCRLGDLLTVCGKRVWLKKGPLEETRDQVTVPNKYSQVQVQANDTLTGAAMEMGEADLCIHSISGTVLRNEPTARWIGTTHWLRFMVNSDTVADVDYIRHMLLTPEMQAACKDVSYGMTMTYLPPAELLELQVPRKTRTEQKKIGAKLRADLKKIERLEQHKSAMLANMSSVYSADPEQQ